MNPQNLQRYCNKTVLYSTSQRENRDISYCFYLMNTFIFYLPDLKFLLTAAYRKGERFQNTVIPYHLITRGQFDISAKTKGVLNSALMGSLSSISINLKIKHSKNPLLHYVLCTCVLFNQNINISFVTILRAHSTITTH